ncbi:DUF2802 domain-containing protein [Thalassotalea ganghwensis]
MNSLLSYLPIALAGIALILALWSLVSTRQKSQQFTFLQSQIESNELMLNQLQLSLSDAQKQLININELVTEHQLENNQVSKQLEHRVKTLQKQLKEHQEAITFLKQQQPEDRLYSRAQKLVALGADAAELMSECDLPLAEAEMLVALHKNKR